MHPCTTWHQPRRGSIPERKQHERFYRREVLELLLDFEDRQRDNIPRLSSLKAKTDGGDHEHENEGDPHRIPRNAWLALIAAFKSGRYCSKKCPAPSIHTSGLGPATEG